MGYILPIQHYQYQEYHNRVTENKRNPYSIEKPFKAILEEQHQEIANKYDRLNGAYKDSQLSTTLEKQLYGDLTGKGSNFSETV